MKIEDERIGLLYLRCGGSKQNKSIVRGCPFMTSALRGGGGVREFADFADKQY